MALIDQGWEYRRLSASSSRERGSLIEIEVNELGADGWEVFQITTLSPITEIIWLRRRLTKWVGSDVD